jgi:hypothetical protein
MPAKKNWQLLKKSSEPGKKNKIFRNSGLFFVSYSKEAIGYTILLQGRNVLFLTRSFPEIIQLFRTTLGFLVIQTPLDT